MDLPLSALIADKILIPFNSSEDAALPRLHSIVIFEPGEKFLAQLKEDALVFFPSGTARLWNPELNRRLALQNCAAVFYASELPSGQLLSCPVYQIPDQSDLSGTVSCCYDQAYRQLQTLARISLETMDRLSAELTNRAGVGDSILGIAGELLGCPVTFATPDMRRSPCQPKEYLVVDPLCATDSFDWDHALMSFSLKDASYYPSMLTGISGSKFGGYRYQNPDLKKSGYCVLVFPITDYSYCYGYLFLALDDPQGQLSATRSIKLQQILSILKFDIIKSDELAHTVNRYYDFLLDEMIESDKTDFRKLMEKYGLVEKPIYDAYYCVIAGRNPDPSPVSPLPFHALMSSQEFNYMYGQLIKVLGTINFFLFERKDYIVTLLPKELIQDPGKDLEPIFSTYQQLLGEQYQGIGISRAVPTEEVRQGYFQALKALSISRNNPRHEPCFYDDLGILQYFFDHSGQVDLTPLMALYREYVLPVVQYDQQHGGELFTTLEGYITYRCSPTAICKALYIHKNTLYSRLNKISQLLDKNLSDSETIFNVSLALKVENLIKAGMLEGGLET